MNEMTENKAALGPSDIRPLIHEIRGVQVMLDHDLAELYQVPTKALNQAVKRNSSRFPLEYCFRLTDVEMAELVTNCDRFAALKHSNVSMAAFTEQGVAMLSARLDPQGNLREQGLFERWPQVKLRRFTDEGIAAVRETLPKIEETGDLSLAAALVTDENKTEFITELADLDLDPDRIFPTTYAFCEYFHSLMKDHKPLAYRTDVGFWTWLAMVYVKQLVKIDAEGRIDCGMEGRILFAGSDYKREYRHLLAAPYYAFLNYEDNWQTCAAVLVQPINAPGDFVDQILTRRVLLQNPCLMKTLSTLFLTDDGRHVRKGAASKIRRFVSFADQIALTRDFSTTEDVAELLALLPEDFHWEENS